MAPGTLVGVKSTIARGVAKGARSPTERDTGFLRSVSGRRAPVLRVMDATAFGSDASRSSDEHRDIPTGTCHYGSIQARELAISRAETQDVTRAILFDPKTNVAEYGGNELVLRWQRSADSIIWLDIDRDDADDAALLEQFDIHPLAVQDALRPRHPPKIERFDGYFFILLKGLSTDSSDIDFDAIQLSLFVGKRFLVSRHTEPSSSANWLFEALQGNPELMANGPGALALRISNRLSRRYVEILLQLEPRLDDIEEEMFEHPDDELLAELTRYKSRLRKLTRIANYHQQIALTLRSTDDPVFDATLTHEIVDLFEQVERTRSLANLYYQISTDLTDGYLGISSHRLNRVMQILTIITVIFVPLTFLAGIYGMNFRYMPELESRYGYFVIIGIMLVVAIAQLVYFRRKRWL